ncbi:MAG: HAD family hydrolase [Ruminococcus sp.]|nr:HAD family hydrolase [Ruminococcus sp.]
MKTAIFDLDGTIADTLADLADAVNYALDKLGYPVHPYESFNQFVGNGVQKLCYRALPDDKKDETENLVGLFSEYYNEHFLDKTVLYKGMSETIHKLGSFGIRLAVATNKPQDFARKIVDALLPDVEFISVLGGCSERPKKPDTAIIREILERLPIEDNQVFMIGDSNVDIQTAKNSGIISIGCIWGFRGREELESEGADYIAETPGDIAKIILEC